MLIFEICAVIATLSLVAIAVATVRGMNRLTLATEGVSKAVASIQEWLVEVGELTREARETVASVRGVIAPVERLAVRFAALGDRTADLASAVLKDVVTPGGTALATLRSLHSITGYLSKRWFRPSSRDAVPRMTVLRHPNHPNAETRANEAS